MAHYVHYVNIVFLLLEYTVLIMTFPKQREHPTVPLLWFLMPYVTQWYTTASWVFFFKLPYVHHPFILLIHPIHLRLLSSLLPYVWAQWTDMPEKYSLRGRWSTWDLSETHCQDVTVHLATRRFQPEKSAAAAATTISRLSTNWSWLAVWQVRWKEGGLYIDILCLCGSLCEFMNTSSFSATSAWNTPTCQIQNAPKPRLSSSCDK